MAASRDIIRSWRAPRKVMRELLAMGQREDRALAYLMSACFLIFIAQWPRLSREAHLLDQDLSQRVSYEFVSWLIVWPLVFYVVAIISHAILRLFRARGSWYKARLALFWALLASTPMMLFYGLLEGLNGQAVATQIVGVGWILSFLVIWVQNLREAEYGDE